MDKHAEFDEIRPYHDEELSQIYEELIEDPEFRKVIEHAFPGIPFDLFACRMRQCENKKEFQRKFGYEYLMNIAQKSTDGLSLDSSSLKDQNRAYTYISNHRDIVLDSGFLSVLLISEGLDSVEIAIGDNLLFLPWIKKLVRINKSFIVQRNVNMRQVFESSARLSRYIHYAVTEKKESVWIAQREGRAKDSNDRTQESLLKMLVMGGEGDMIDRFKSLNIVPLAISYEYDPCDFLKAEEFQRKRDIEGYKKEFKDDLKNMQTGILGYKGKVGFRTGNCMNDYLDQLDRNLSKGELLSLIAAWIDKEIHRNYTLYPVNYIAHDLLKQQQQFSDKYTQQDKDNFEKYLEQQLDKIELTPRDTPFLRERILTMYSYPLINYQEAIQ